MASVVDLPQPEGPSSETNSPGASASSSPSTAVTGAEALAQLLEREARRRAHRFTAPKVSPRTRWRWIT